jgi:hypothetical protein
VRNRIFDVQRMPDQDVSSFAIIYSHPPINLARAKRPFDYKPDKRVLSLAPHFDIHQYQPERAQDRFSNPSNGRRLVKLSDRSPWNAVGLPIRVVSTCHETKKWVFTHFRRGHANTGKSTNQGEN